MSTLWKQQLLNYLLTIVGFLFSVLAGHYLTKFVMDGARCYEKSRKSETKEKNEEKFEKFPQAIGFIERLIYTASWILNLKEFIGVWLVLKAVGVWTEGLSAGWGQEEKGIFGRVRYYSFLVGTSLSLLFGVAGGFFIEKSLNYQWGCAFFYPLLLVFGTFVLRKWFQN